MSRADAETVSVDSSVTGIQQAVESHQSFSWSKLCSAYANVFKDFSLLGVPAAGLQHHSSMTFKFVSCIGQTFIPALQAENREHVEFFVLMCNACMTCFTLQKPSGFFNNCFPASLQAQAARLALHAVTACRTKQFCK